MAVVLAVGGITLFAYDEGFAGGMAVHSVVGVALSVGAAIGAALYKVCILLLSH